MIGLFGFLSSVGAMLHAESKDIAISVHAKGLSVIWVIHSFNFKIDQ
jgi:hypothetical protein